MLQIYISQQDHHIFHVLWSLGQKILPGTRSASTSEDDLFIVLANFGNGAD